MSDDGKSTEKNKGEGCLLLNRVVRDSLTKLIIECRSEQCDEQAKAQHPAGGTLSAEAP